jgi:hypothetical protein
MLCFQMVKAYQLRFKSDRHVGELQVQGKTVTDEQELYKGKIMRQKYLVAAATLVGLFSAMPAFCQDAPENPWPRNIQISQGTILICQPQPEELEGNQLKARAAISIELNDAEEPVFGVAWIATHLETDRVERTATLADITVTRTRFPWIDCLRPWRYASSRLKPSVRSVPTPQ